MMKHREDEYAFPCAIIRGNERTLMSRADLLKVIEAKQFNQAMAVLAEFGYGDGKELTNPRDFEQVLRSEQRRVKALVFSVVPDKSELEMLLYPADYHNVKVLLKAEFLGIAPESYLTDGGMIPAEKLRRMVQDRNLVFLSVPMKEAINEAVDLFAKGRDPQEIDIILDKACYRDMAGAAAQTDNAFLQGYVRLLIDMLNVNTFVRLRQMNKPWAFFQKVFLEGGQIDQRVLIGSYEEPYQQLADKLAPYGFREVLASGAVTARDTGKYTLMEKLCDDMRMHYLRDAKYVMMGLAPVAAFYLAKESEIKNLRMVLTGKLSQTAEETMKERLRETYV